MSYDPKIVNQTEFVFAYESNVESLPTKTTSDTVTNYDTTLTLSSQKEENGTTLTSNVLSLNVGKALFWGDIRVNTQSVKEPFFKIEFENNDLVRSSALQAESGSSSAEDCCFSVANSAELKIKIVQYIGGVTITPYTRILGMAINQ